MEIVKAPTLLNHRNLAYFLLAGAPTSHSEFFGLGGASEDFGHDDRLAARPDGAARQPPAPLASQWPGCDRGASRPEGQVGGSP